MEQIQEILVSISVINSSTDAMSTVADAVSSAKKVDDNLTNAHDNVDKVNPPYHSLIQVVIFHLVRQYSKNYHDYRFCLLVGSRIFWNSCRNIQYKGSRNLDCYDWIAGAHYHLG